MDTVRVLSNDRLVHPHCWLIMFDYPSFCSFKCQENWTNT